MLDIDSIASQVKHNCNISDAKYWGFYSPCALLLRLRDLYKIEKGIRPEQKINHEEIVRWIGEREVLWEQLSSLNFQEIEINDKKYHPFDVKGINSVLIKNGILYGAGYGEHLKPIFLLAEMRKTQKIGKYTVYFSGKEYARDLSATPAMIQGNTIITRFETMRLFIIDKFKEMRSQSGSTALCNAFLQYGISRDAKLSSKRLQRQLDEIVDNELHNYVYHELGEASQRKILGRWWKELVMMFPHTRAELFLRALKDILSDTCKEGMLRHIINQKNIGSLSFYVALLGGFRKIIFRNIEAAYEEFINTHNWEVIEKARIETYKKTRGYIKTLKEIMSKGTISAEEIEDKLISKII
jgi:hypothetical protein